MAIVTDVFNQNGWGVIDFHEEVIERIDYRPQLLGSLNIFEPIFSRSRTIAIADRNRTLSLIPTSELGAPPEELIPEGAKVRPFNTNRLAKGSTIYAAEMAGVTALPFDVRTKDVAGEVTARAAEIMDDMELTWEHMRLGALQGRVLDADGSTVLHNWFDEWGIAEPAEINFALGTDSTNVRQQCQNVVRAMRKVGKGVWVEGRTMVHALVGDKFYDDLISHPEVEKFYLQWSAAQDLRNAGAAYGSFEFGGIMWHNYQGTDDDATVAIGADKARFFPVGARGAFKAGFSPAQEFKPYLNQRARTHYGLLLEDKSGRDAWDRIETYSYPLMIATRPEMLLRAKGR